MMYLNITKSLVWQTIFFTPVIAKYMKKTLFIMKPRYSEKNFASPLALRYIKVPLYSQ